jgi:alkaline phosphatase
MKNIKYWIVLSFIAIFLSLTISCNSNHQAPVSVIILIGDGMGPEQQKAASYYLTGREAVGYFGEGCRLLVYRLLGKETKVIQPNSLNT